MPPIATLASKQRHRGERRREEHLPSSGCDQREGKEDAELRLDREQADQHAGRDRPLVEQCEDREQRRGREKRALTGQHAEQRRGRHQHDDERAPVGDFAAAGEIEGKQADRKPGEQRREISEQAERRHHDQRGRRVRPVLAGIAGAEQTGERGIIGRRRRRSARDRARTTRRHTSTGSGNRGRAPASPCRAETRRPNWS